MDRHGRLLASGLRLVPHHVSQAEMDAREAEIDLAVAETTAEIARHVDHRRAQVGRCVYCRDCGVRLYQGQLVPDPPDPHEFDPA